MKFKKLTIHNIASIEDAEIDFEASPLAESEVFLITGKTGAGKSTILDSICLALYANTPRLHDTKMQGETADTEEKTVKINDPRQLMRRNTGEAFTSLTFTGSNGLDYMAKWSVARSRKKVDGTLQSKSWELTNLSTNVSLRKDNDIKAEIANAIGLDFNQFCRTTMLAQGEFTRFLDSSDDEKAAILEKITGVNVYSKIGKKIFEVTGQKKQVWEDVQRQVSGIRVLSEAEIKEKQDSLASINLQLGAKQKEIDTVSAKQQWLQTEEKLIAELSKAKSAYALAVEASESEENKQKDLLVKEWNSTIEARNWLNGLNQAVSQCETMNTALTDLSQEFIRIIGGKQFIINRRQQLESSKRAVDSFIEGQKPKSVVYDNAQKITSLLEAIASGYTEVSEKQKEIDKERKALEEKYQPAQKKAVTESNEAEKLLDTKDNELKEQEKILAERNLPELRKQRESILSMLSNIEIANVSMRTLSQMQNTMTDRRNRLYELKKKIDDKQAESKTKVPIVHDAEVKKDTCIELLNRQRDTIDTFAKSLRSKLTLGDICPVCHQKIDAEIPHEEEFERMFECISDECNAAQKKYEKLVGEKDRLDAEIKSLNYNYSSEKKSIDEDKSVDEAERKALEACKVVGIDILDDGTLDFLEELKKANEIASADFDAKISSAEEIEKNVNKLRKEQEELSRKKNKAEEVLHDSEVVVNNCDARIESAQGIIDSNQKNIKKAEKDVSSLILDAKEWDRDWHEDPLGFSKELTDASKIYNDKKKEQTSLETNINSLNTEISNVEHVSNLILSVEPEWKILASDKSVEIKDLLKEANHLNNSLTTVLSRLDDATKSKRTNSSSLEEFLSQNESVTKERLALLNEYDSNQIIREGEAIKVIHDNVTKTSAALNIAQQNMDNHIQQKPVMSEEDSLDTLAVVDAQLKKEKEKLFDERASINQELINDAENKKTIGKLIKDADTKRSEYMRWDRMNRLIGDATGNKFRKIAQSYVLTSLIHSANSYMKTLTDRYTLKISPGSFVIETEDAYQGYVSRAASTISGGESFLVSLSLALALSDIGQQLRVDTLFIDEGFGTLSGTPLQKAVDTLRSLHTKAGRHVGIISHIEELQDKIPVQIKVNQIGNSSRSTIDIIS